MNWQRARQLYLLYHGRALGPLSLVNLKQRRHSRTGQPRRARPGQVLQECGNEEPPAHATEELSQVGDVDRHVMQTRTSLRERARVRTLPVCRLHEEQSTRSNSQVDLPRSFTREGLYRTSLQPVESLQDWLQTANDERNVVERMAHDLTKQLGIIPRPHCTIGIRHRTPGRYNYVAASAAPAKEGLLQARVIAAGTDRRRLCRSCA